MKRLKSIISFIGLMLLILSAASFYISAERQSEILPASSYEDQGICIFEPYDVLPMQSQNSGAVGRGRRMTPSKTVYMVYYRATDGSGYQWSEEALTKSMGQDIVNAGRTVERRVLRIPEEGTYITVEPIQTAESYTAALRERYNMISGFAVIYIFLYVVVRAFLFLWRRLSRRNRNVDEVGASNRTASNPASSGPEILEAKPHRRGKKLLLILLPVVLLAVIVIGMSRSSSEAPDMDFGWNGNVWASDVLGLRYTLPATGEKRDVGEVEADRESKFGHRRSAGQTILAAVDPAEGSSISLVVVIDHPTEKELQRNLEYTVQYLAQDGPYELISLGEETLAGQTWRAWRIELPERGLVHYYLVRQNGAFWLILSTNSPMAETPPAILTGFEGETSFQTAAVNTYLPPANKEGYLVATFPPALLGNETAEELVTSFYEDLASASDMTPEELQTALYWSDITANEDGSVSYYFTPEQYQKTKKTYYAWGTRVINDDFLGFNPSDIVKRLEYTGVDEAGVPRAVTAWVNQEYFQDGGTFSDFVARFVPMTIIGRYQIMCGIPGDEWAVHVTVRDADTGNVTYEGDFSQSPSEPPESEEIG